MGNRGGGSIDCQGLTMHQPHIPKCVRRTVVTAVAGPVTATVNAVTTVGANSPWAHTYRSQSEFAIGPVPVITSLHPCTDEYML